MYTTATTTDTQINAPVAAARDELATLLTQDPTPNADQLGQAVRRLAFQEGTAEVRTLVRNGLVREAAPARIRDMMLRLLVTGADDDWSGRGNDVRRARFDGVRNAVDDLMYSLPADPATV